MSVSSNHADGGDITTWTRSDHQTFHDKKGSSHPAASPYSHHSSLTASWPSSQSSPSLSPFSGSGMSSSPIPDQVCRGTADSEDNRGQNQRQKVPFRKFELGKMAMTVVAPTTTVLVCMKVWTYSSPVAAIPLLFLCYGCLSIIVGVAMSHDFPSVARLIEEVGVILVFGSFTWAMSSMFYPWLYLMLIPMLCFSILLVTLVVLRYVDSKSARVEHRRCKCKCTVDAGDA